jgi:hypothetical protein
MAAMPPLTYENYKNARFLFSVDVPAFFHTEPSPTNGDGQEWTWGSRAKMIASGMHRMSLTTDDLCKEDFAKRKGVKAKSITKNGCWITGIDAGQVYWERRVLSGEFLYSLSFAYDESVRGAFDPLVSHVNASWVYRKCEASRIDACGLCYLRCKSTADCDREGDVCKPVTCGPDAFGADPVLGMGCVNPDDEFSIGPGALRMDESP